MNKRDFQSYKSVLLNSWSIKVSKDKDTWLVIAYNLNNQHFAMQTFKDEEHAVMFIEYLGVM
jgi:urease accessory protein UreE